MITNNNNIFHIATKNISYIIGIRSNRFLENLYFGRKIPNQIDYSALTEKFANPYVAASKGYIDSVIEPKETRSLLLHALKLSALKSEARPHKKHGIPPF